MLIKIKDLNVNVERSGEGNHVLLLHGWGQNLEMMLPIQKALETSFCVHNFDLPAFGKSDEPTFAYDIEDYVSLIREYIVLNNISNPIFIGHSFGCRIALLYASKYPTHKLILTGAAGIKDKHGIDYYARVYTYKAVKNILKLPFLKQYEHQIKSKFGSTDYKNASQIKRGILVKAVNKDLTNILELINCPTLLVFGENDDQTPLWMAKIMENKMKDAGLVVFENAGHFAYYEQMPRFLLIVDSFLTKDKKESF